MGSTAMVLVNGQGTIVLVNAQTEQVFGYRREELVGQWWKFSSQSASSGHTRVCAKAFRTIPVPAPWARVAIFMPGGGMAANSR